MTLVEHERPQAPSVDAGNCRPDPNLGCEPSPSGQPTNRRATASKSVGRLTVTVRRMRFWSFPPVGFTPARRANRPLGAGDVEPKSPRVAVGVEGDRKWKSEFAVCGWSSRATLESTLTPRMVALIEASRASNSSSPS